MTANEVELNETYLLNPLNTSVAHIETSQLICYVNQLTSFYMRTALAFN